MGIDLDVGTDSHFDAADDLQNQPVTEAHEPVPLSSETEGGCKRLLGVASQQRKRFGLPCRQLAARTRTVRLSFEQSKQVIAKFGIDKRLIEYRGLAAIRRFHSSPQI